MTTFEPGAPLPELRVTPDRFLTYRYAGASGDFNPIHLDDDFAKMVGMPSRILHGLWSMAQVARAQTEAGKLHAGVIGVGQVVGKDDGRMRGTKKGHRCVSLFLLAR